ncbi:hypothetical protein [Mesorhizobium onobrychidis]|uniref:Transposase n=1 Tax=Mesorhizobium onobrychidis TaxID=2775404 RepID=A0ABY5QZ23_9HYPH|nr:hypothetical protein [Mesorhizobium onobrychidis]UVC15312.1 hypothetical protein IHQ72_33150 [Mesorhizobium onobrychidis]
MRAFLGWLLGEKRHCSMAAIPTIDEEEARRPNRERDNLVRERTRIVNRIKAVLARFGIRAFKPNLRKAAEKLEALHTAEGMPLPERSRAELRRNLVREQIHEIEQERLRQRSVVLDTEKDPLAMVRLLAQISGVGIETADMLVNEILSRGLRVNSSSPPQRSSPAQQRLALLFHEQHSHLPSFQVHAKNPLPCRIAVAQTAGSFQAAVSKGCYKGCYRDNQFPFRGIANRFKRQAVPFGGVRCPTMSDTQHSRVR